MCLAFPGKIVSLEKNQQATVDFNGIEKKISIALTPEAKIGDFVIVHAGFAAQILSKEDAFEVINEYEKAYEIKKRLDCQTQ